MKQLDRRSFLARSGVVLGAAGAAAYVDVARGGARRRPTPRRRRPAPPWPATDLSAHEPFTGVHQSGILNPAPAQATLVALDSFAPDHQHADAGAAGAQPARAGAHGRRPGSAARGRRRRRPTPDARPDNAPDALTVTIGFGSSLFDHRYGLAPQRPRELTPMPTFPVDELDPDRMPRRRHAADLRRAPRHRRAHAARADAHGARRASSSAGRSTASRAPTAGRRRRAARATCSRSATAPPTRTTTDAKLMDELAVWPAPASRAGPPAAPTRSCAIIRMHVEFWDRVGLLEQENMIGRARDTGAPLGGTDEFEDPRYDLDPQGNRIPLDAHIRLANPRTPADRRPADPAPRLQLPPRPRRGRPARPGPRVRRLQPGHHAPVRDRSRTASTDEPMVDYITPVGGGYFFVPPGAQPQRLRRQRPLRVGGARPGGARSGYRPRAPTADRRPGDPATARTRPVVLGQRPSTSSRTRSSTFSAASTCLAPAGVTTITRARRSVSEGWRSARPAASSSSTVTTIVVLSRPMSRASSVWV